MKRNTMSRPVNLNDAVDGIVLALMDAEDADFMRFMEPAYSEQSVHGDLFLDDAEMAKIIIAKAKEQNVPVVYNTKLKGVIRAMNVVLRRYQYTRAQRRMEAEAEAESNGEL